MEKQNNNNANNNVDSNETKPPKKKMKVSTIVIIVLAVLLLFSCVGNMGGSDSSPSTSSTSTTSTTVGEKDTEEGAKEENTELEEGSEEKSEKATEEVAEKSKEPEQVANNNKYVGDTVKYEGGLILRIQDAGIYQSEPFNTLLVYMELECENTSDEIITIYNNDLELYIDDYQIDVVPEVNGDDPSIHYSVDINPGRKMMYKPVARLPEDYDSADKIELSFTGWRGASLLIKDNGVYLNGRKDASVKEDSTADTDSYGLDDSWYGDDYVSMDGLDCVLTFEPAPYVDAVVTINPLGYQWRLFMEDERNGYLTYMEGDDKVGSIYFGMDGIEFKCDSNPEFNGLYW